MCVTRVNEIRASIILKTLIFHSFKASGSTCYRLHQRLMKSFKISSDLSTTFREINIRRKSIFRTFRNNIANSSVRNINLHYEISFLA